MNKKINISYPVIVEGKYDKNTLLQVINATVITTGGFSIFNSREKQGLIKKLAERGGIILLTDSDGGGVQIRRFLHSILPPERVHNLYIPSIAGKEKRKARPSRAGTLGVEGMERELLEGLFLPFSDEKLPNSQKNEITKLDFFEAGLSGGANAVQKRDALALRFGLPRGMSANALIEALNILSCREEFFAELNKTP